MYVHIHAHTYIHTHTHIFFIPLYGSIRLATLIYLPFDHFLHSVHLLLFIFKGLCYDARHRFLYVIFIFIRFKFRVRTFRVRLVSLDSDIAERAISRRNFSAIRTRTFEEAWISSWTGERLRLFVYSEMPFAFKYLVRSFEIYSARRRRFIHSRSSFFNLPSNRYLR